MNDTVQVGIIEAEIVESGGPKSQSVGEAIVVSVGPNPFFFNFVSELMN